MGAITEGLKGKKTEDGKDHDGIINDLDDEFKKEIDKADRYFEQVYELMKKTGTTKQLIMKGTKSAEKVKELYGEYLNDVIYMPIVNLDKSNAEQQLNQFMKDMNPVAFELLFKSDENKLPLSLPKKMKGKSLIWYNTLWAVSYTHLIRQGALVGANP